MHIKESTLAALDSSHGRASNNIPSPLNDLEHLLLNHRLHCDCGSGVLQSLPDHRVDELRTLLLRASYRDWKISLSHNQGSALCASAISICPPLTEAEAEAEAEVKAMESTITQICPKMTDEFVIDLIFEMVKHIEVKLVLFRFSVAA
jgi:hypothetical protein